MKTRVFFKYFVPACSNRENSYNTYTFEVVNDKWNFHFLWINAVIQVECVVNWTSIFTRQMIVVADFFICWLEWFDADWAVRGVIVFPPLFLGQPFHKDFIGQVLSTDGCCGYDLVQKPFSGALDVLQWSWWQYVTVRFFLSLYP